ncbi:MAG TPA: hypothetical protein VMH87_05705, partial [Pseudomonadales bacterium]|nr:hypothetical protein [Pseudomonadales bacterium]
MTVKKSYSSDAACLLHSSGTKAGILDCSGPGVVFQRIQLCQSGRSPRLGKARTPSNAQTKSTVDLGLEPLIWGENTPLRVFPLYQQHSFRPITTSQWNYQNQKQTNPNQIFIQP